MNNPFDLIDARLSNIETLLLDLKHGAVVPKQTTTKTETVTRKQAAEHLKISLPTLNEYTKSGKIQGLRIGRRVLYKCSDLDAALTTIKTKEVENA